MITKWFLKTVQDNGPEFKGTNGYRNILIFGLLIGTIMLPLISLNRLIINTMKNYLGCGNTNTPTPVVFCLIY